MRDIQAKDIPDRRGSSKPIHGLRKVRNGGYVELSSDNLTEIVALWVSAFNHGAIHAPVMKLEFADTNERLAWEVLIPRGATWGFSISVHKLIQWRKAIEALAFDCERLETDRFNALLEKRALAWFEALPVTQYQR